MTLLAEVDLVARIAGSGVGSRRIRMIGLPLVGRKVRRRLDCVTSVAKLQPKVVALEAVVRADSKRLGSVGLQPVGSLVKGGPRKYPAAVASLAIRRRDDLRQVGRLMSESTIARVTRRAVDFEIGRGHRRPRGQTAELRMAFLAKANVNPPGHDDIAS